MDLLTAKSCSEIGRVNKPSAAEPKKERFKSSLKTLQIVASL